MRLFIIMTACALLAACQHDIPEPPPAITFAAAPYALNVGSINVIEDYVSPRHAPNAEQLFDMPPDKAMKDWATSRLVAAGKAGTLEVDIINASVIRKNIPKQKTGLEGLLTKEQTEEYDGTLEVTLKIYDDVAILPVAHAHVSAHQTLTLREDATLLERKALYRQLTANLMQAIDSELNKNIRQYFSHYLM